MHGGPLYWTIDITERMTEEAVANPLPKKPSNGRMTKSEIDVVSRALRVNVRAAHTQITALGPKLKAEFELQLSTSYPASGDPVWNDALNQVYQSYTVQQARVNARSEELGIPERFRPQIREPGWASSWKSSCFDYKEYRAELCKLANAQIDDMLKSRRAQLELDSANIQYEIASHGCITDTAREFLAKLPAIEAMIPPLQVSEVAALIEGRPTGERLAISNGAPNPQLPSSSNE